MLRCALLLVLLALASQTNGAPGIAPQIIGGANSVRDQFPYQVALEINGATCGGSIISNQWILTAAHCVSAAVNQITVTIGGFDKNAFEDQRVKMQTTERIIHETYERSTLKDDIAVVKLPMPIPLPTTHWKAIRLPTQTQINNANFAGLTATASGWGDIVNQGTEFITKMSFVDLTVMSNAECAAETGAILDSVLCALGNYNGATKGICQGDSGGPLAYKDPADNTYTLIGVTSYTDAAGCQALKPTGFARVTSYMPWISLKTGIPIAP